MTRIDQDVATLDLDPIAFKVCMDEGWTISRVDATLEQYRAFLQAIRNMPGEPLAPTKDVDTVWHHHILDTEKYMSDCEIIFGRYIHHYPYSGVLGGNDASEQASRFERSQEIIREYLPQ